MSDPPASKSLTFADGDSLESDTVISWGIGLNRDRWKPDDARSKPGHWMFASTEGNCTAQFGLTAIDESSGMDERAASEAIPPQRLPGPGEGIGDFMADGIFLADAPTWVTVEHRQFTFTADGTGFFTAARAFTEPGIAVDVVVVCDAAALTSTIKEVLSNSAVNFESR
ncbi:hypothetical protein L2X99_15215 [Microbacterium sp. KUDC0406]|uniref:hypothetical protein n=1 Tax=Microbacterium sp. KUDC0406 TaxID=2909588 RepID=UPI001F2DB7DE|nr:hypothetical protein [Microbacterium sp. KUDC0406]UJP09731.1 hypothetical protein L2X99_15215 [Microbacterium sp. KUDC0406]